MTDLFVKDEEKPERYFAEITQDRPGSRYQVKIYDRNNRYYTTEPLFNHRYDTLFFAKSHAKKELKRIRAGAKKWVVE